MRQNVCGGICFHWQISLWLWNEIVSSSGKMKAIKVIIKEKEIGIDICTLYIYYIYIYIYIYICISSVQFSCSVVSDSLWPHESQHARPPYPSPSMNSWSSPKLTCIESVMPSSHLILCHPLLLPPPIPPSIRVFSNKSTLFCCCQVASVMSDSVWPHRRQPTRLPCPWDSPGKNTGVGCHFLFQCMKVKSESEVAQSCPTLSDPMDCSLPGSSIHGIL